MTYYRHTLLSGILNGVGLIIMLTAFMRPVLMHLGLTLPYYLSLVGLIPLLLSYRLAHKRTVTKLPESVVKAEGLSKFGYLFMICIAAIAVLAFFPVGQDAMKSAWTSAAVVLVYCIWTYGRYRYQQAYEVVVRKHEASTVF
ncbi:hypothetical protein PQU92_05390 [Asticcacaulis sp. BYS171W]|uniref:Amino acid permease n=1 Tax=Asticcacaulis aquaticus TaxID=2984212 RepID=A0ABT5HRL5_9CAUL|nr:hypothetical protein [Asticcacaulis aquaticus]MDC7682699.1 hypothetical protein [Asticcacaulis aquaticus]